MWAVDGAGQRDRDRIGAGVDQRDFGPEAGQCDGNAICGNQVRAGGDVMSNFTAEARRRGADRAIWPSGHRDTGLSGYRSLGIWGREKSGGIPEACDDRAGVAQRGVSTSRTIYGFICGAYRVLKATLREIFDESAYDRFLAHTRSERSVSSYHAFMRERESTMARKPRCC